MIYGSQADAEASLEAIDIDDGEYSVAYTETGEALQVRLDEPFPAPAPVDGGAWLRRSTPRYRVPARPSRG